MYAFLFIIYYVLFIIPAKIVVFNFLIKSVRVRLRLIEFEKKIDYTLVLMEFEHFNANKR